jgi:hypothetical protein
LSTTTPPTIRVIAKMRTGPKISFQISNPNRTQPTVPSPDQMAYATPSGMYLRSNSHADKPLGQTGCSTVAVHGVRRHPSIYLIFYVLPANQHFLRADEQTRTADLISLRVIGQVLQGCAGDCKYRIFRGFPFPALLRVAPYCVRGGIRVVSTSP